MPNAWVAQALEAARRYWDATFHLAMCANSARPELLADGTHSREEHTQACAELRHAEDALIDAEGALARHFSDENGYPITAKEMLAKIGDITTPSRTDE